MASAAAKAFERLVDDVIAGRARWVKRRDMSAFMLDPSRGTMTPEQRRERDRLKKAEWRAARATGKAPDKRPQKSSEREAVNA